MSEKTVIDVRGLSCPEPVLEVKDALKQLGGAAFDVLLDGATARDNVLRLLQGEGRDASLEDKKDEWMIKVKAK